MRRILSLVSILSLLVTLAGAVQAQQPNAALVQVTISSPEELARFRGTGLPAYTPPWGSIPDSILTGVDPAGRQALSQAGLSFRVLDPDMAGAAYYLVYPAPGRTAPDWSSYGRVLLATDWGVLLRTTPERAAQAALAGAELQALTLTPKPLDQPSAEQAFPTAITPDPLIQLMIDQVTQAQVYQYDGDLSGEWPVSIGGTPYTILTRHTYSGTPIQKATQLVYEHLQNLGMAVEYHQWGGSTYPNVIGEITGYENPDDIFIICAHLDDMPSGGRAPGADDNASGSVAVMMAADILSQYQWGCTLRFAFWTGEEQGLNGSAAYAQRAYQRGENIVGVLNLDMIAWDALYGPDIDLHANSAIPQTLQLAQLFADVVDAYNLNLIPGIEPNGSGASDHASFWDYGYPAILGIEDYYPNYHDFNDYYHTSNDLLQYLNMPYFTDFVKASVGTFAHMSGCLIPSGLGTLDGHVTEAGSGLPVAGVTVTMVNQDGHTFSDSTDANGYYTRTVLAGTYTVTAAMYGYIETTVTGIEVLTDTNTHLDIALPLAPSYLVYGRVTEAGTGQPLAAQVRVMGTPLAPVATNPDTGYYEITVAEGTYTFSATASQHAPEARLVVVNQNQEQNLHLYPICDILNDDVESGNQGWTAESPWAITTEASHSPTHSWTDSPGSSYGNNRNVSLTSPSFNLSDYSGVSLQFWHTYATETDYDYCYVEYSTDGGGTWTTVASYDGSQGWNQQTFPLPALDGQPNARIRFRFDSDEYITADGWHVDDIVLSGGGPACIPPLAPVAEFQSNSPVDLGEPAIFTNLTSGSPPLEYWWDLGDGTTSTEENPTHLYAAPGTYDVTLVATNTLGSDSVSHPFVVQCDPVEGAEFTWTPPAPHAGQSITFTGSAGGTPPISFAWDLGDGTQAAGAVIEHAYSQAGAYTVVLTATNCLTRTDVVSHVVTVAAGCDPVGDAAFGWTPTVPAVGQVVTLTASASGTLPIAYTWDMGDGALAAGAVVTHTYDQPGAFSVVLTATNDCGHVTVTQAVRVSPLADAGFTVSAPLCPNEPALFTNTSSGAENYWWDLGDGTTSTETNPVHTYTAAGAYTVTLEACNDAGCDTAVGQVEVLPEPQAAFDYAAHLLTVTFTNASANAAAYLWAFGDGATSAETNPVHAYPAAGTYTVTLTATGVCGEDTISYAVTVVAPPHFWKVYLPIVFKG